MELTLGNGTIMVASVERDGRKGLLLRPVDKVYEIDTADPEWLKDPEYIPTDNDVIVWIDNLAGARVLQDRVNILTLEHNSYKITDA